MSATVVPWKGRKKGEGTLEGLMISREASAVIVRDEINEAPYEISDEHVTHRLPTSSKETGFYFRDASWGDFVLLRKPPENYVYFCC